MQFFCEEGQCRSEDFFGLFERFRVSYLKSMEEVEVMNKMDVKRAAMAKAKAEAEEKKKQKADAMSNKRVSKAADKEAVSDLLKHIPKRS